MTKQAQVKNIIAILELVQQRPKSFFDIEISALLAFLRGFQVACNALALDYQAAYHAVQQAHGWRVNALHPVHAMQQMGMEVHAIIAEALALEVEAWQQVLEKEQV